MQVENRVASWVWMYMLLKGIHTVKRRWWGDSLRKNTSLLLRTKLTILLWKKSILQPSIVARILISTSNSKTIHFTHFNYENQSKLPQRWFHWWFSPVGNHVTSSIFATMAAMSPITLIFASPPPPHFSPLLSPAPVWQTGETSLSLSL